MEIRQQISYIAPGAPARRRSASGEEAYLRPEIGFTPKWYRAALGIDFGKRWHTDPAYRRETIAVMRSELRRRFAGMKIGGIDRPDKPVDVLTGTYGASIVAGIYGVPILYAEDKWPDCERKYLSDEEVDRLEAPELETNVLFSELMAQVEWIAAHEGQVEGFINWQGVLNNAYRLRGERLFYDIAEALGRCRRLFDCICTTMIDAEKRLHQRQWESGVEVDFTTVSNCMVNMISPQQYRELLLDFDLRIEDAFGCIAIHNCAWNVDAYLDDYAMIPHLGYIDMGLETNLGRIREVITDARRAVMYKPTELANKTLEVIQADLERIARECGPCDVVVGDIDVEVPDERILLFVEMCEEISVREG